MSEEEFESDEWGRAESIAWEREREREREKERKMKGERKSE